ncbi:LysR family transcriptional regulator [Hahella sp. CCB-MM4]|uniref:LysR family transcriptional regulator n=1 Tax=Hahella sp. (strain CCB-MM4) TaxID=1926491 RepID=UPI000B9AEA9C|nr:LysR family transcriptional regulator [Hahella sp. CCB-MM4]OZG73183.1 LysR family transcriptional regulator [Hahella sp. CCB-MM4]
MKNQDLTLLYVFDAIMTEGSVTRAADRLAMTQPAVSNAVSRMRHLWKDPLFVKKGRSIEPTSFALSLWDQVRAPMHELSNAIDASAFEPAESKRKFRIAVTDVLVDLIWQSLACSLQRKAPGIDLYAVPYTQADAFNQLREAHVDLAIGMLTGHDSSLRSIWLFDSEYTLAMRDDHPLAKNGITLKDFLAAKHLMVSLSGDTTGIVDLALSQRGWKRRVAVTVNHFAVVPQLLRESDMIAVIPKIATGGAGYQDGIWFADVPFDLDPTSIYLIWHTRHDRDPGLMWMRQLVEDITKMKWKGCAHCTGKGSAVVGL